MVVFSVITAVNAQNVCIACHKTSTPSIVEDWNKSRHSETGVSCYTCHQVKEGDFSEEHHGETITPVVSPKKLLCVMKMNTSVMQGANTVLQQLMDR